jgi:glycyl-tRNA synthetase
LSQAYWKFGGLRFWSEDELAYRDLAVREINRAVERELMSLNRAWEFIRCEAPMLVPASTLNPAYTADDVWMLESPIGAEQPVAMRPETTAGSYEVARQILSSTKIKPPLAIWQVGKSYRRETNDGASASKLRFNEFTQAEWQCIYKADSMADYRAAVEEPLRTTLAWLCRRQDARIVPSDRLPSYSQVTNDVEVLRSSGRWTEVCSISTRTDFGEGFLVLEVAVGIDRVVDIAGE